MNNGAARSDAACATRSAVRSPGIPRSPRAGAALSALLAALLTATALTGCSNGESAANRQPHEGTATASAADGIQSITLMVDNGFRFHPSTIVVHPGTVRVTLDHGPTGAPHDWQLTGLPGAYVSPVTAGGTGSVTFTAPAPGKYTFVCTIHERQGQTGTMIVLAG